MKFNVAFAIVLGCFLWLASAASAAYTTATIVSNTFDADTGLSALKVRFTGNAGEPAVDRTLTIDGSTTALAVRQWRDGQIIALNNARTVFSAAIAQPGQVITAAPSVSPSQADIDRADWFRKLERYLRAKRAADAGLAVPTAAQIAALKTDLESTYQASYLAEF
jgi:hypothetical protein